MSIKGQRHSLNLAKGHPDFKVKCLTLACILRWAIQGLMALLLYLVVDLFLHIYWLDKNVVTLDKKASTNILAY